MAQLDRRNALKLLSAGSTAVALGGPSILGVAALAAERLAGPGETLHEKIAKYLVNARFEDMPPAVIRKAKEQIVYLFGRAFEVALLEHGRQMLQVMQPLIPERGGASVIGQRLRLTPSDAAFANATPFGGSASKDDVLTYADIHAGVITLPAALSMHKHDVVLVNSQPGGRHAREILRFICAWSGTRALAPQRYPRTAT